MSYEKKYKNNLKTHKISKCDKIITTKPDENSLNMTTDCNWLLLYVADGNIMNITSPFQQLSLQLYPFEAHKSVSFFSNRKPVKNKGEPVGLCGWGGLFIDMIRNA